MKFPLLSKAIAITLVAAVLGMVLARIGFLVDERSERQDEALRSVQQSHAGAQTLLGPVLLQSCVEEWDSVSGEGKDRRMVVERREFALQATPTTLDATAKLRAEARYRGLFKVNGYNAHLTLDAQWPAAALPAATREHAGSRLGCTAPRLWLALGDVRGVRQAVVTVDGRPLEVRAGTGHGVYAQGLHVELPPEAANLDAPRTAPLPVHVELDLVGTSRLALVPAAGDTHWQADSDWPHPSFGGRFLPLERTVRADGFTAQWRVSALASAATAQVLRGEPLCQSPARRRGATGESYDEDGLAAAGMDPTPKCLDSLDVAFIDPVNPYVLSDRATKYGMLFIALTFIALSLAEILAGPRVRRVHPVQYGLVGLALTLFFLLLLSLSEHLSFALAYAIASAACVLLLGAYAVHALGGRREGLVFGIGLGGVYGLLYVLLQREQTALVIGSVGLFAAVAAVMWLTRRIDWYRLFDDARTPPTPRRPGAA